MLLSRSTTNRDYRRGFLTMEGIVFRHVTINLHSTLRLNLLTYMYSLQSPSTRPPPCPRSSSGQSSVSRARALLDCFSSLFRCSHTAFDGTTHTTQTPFRSLTRTPAHFSQCHRPGDEQRLHAVEVPCTRGLRVRCYLSDILNFLISYRGTLSLSNHSPRRRSRLRKIS